jgi:hypothetical protein
MSRCGTCLHWDLKGSPLRASGFGRCKVEPDHAMRSARTFSPQRECRIGRFEKASIEVIALRERALG